MTTRTVLPYQDLTAEVEIAAEWAQGRGVDLVLLPDPTKFPIDFGVIKADKMVGVAEVRDLPTFPTDAKFVGLRLYKAMSLYSYHREDIPAFFIVRLAGKVKWIRLNERIERETWSIRWIGKQPIVLVPVGLFKT